MRKILEILKKKPFIFLGISLVYIFSVGLLKWRMQPPTSAVYFLVGGFLGVYLLDFAESIFQVNPSPFRSVVFAGAFAMVSFFVVTSSGSLLGSGLVLSLYLNLIFWQIGEWQFVGNLYSWYRMVAGLTAKQTQKWILIGFIALFIIETYLFIR